MSNIEDDLAQVMAAHEHEAPAVADLTRALESAASQGRRLGAGRQPGAGQRAGLRQRAGLHQRSRRYAPLAAALAVAVVAAGSAWVSGLVGGRVHGSGPAVTSLLSCPSRYGGPAPWVPAKPAGVDGRSRLVPRRVPGAALVCAYSGRNTAAVQSGWTLSGSRVLTGGLARLATQLTWQPRKLPGQDKACTLIGGTQVDYLVGLTYRGGGTMWVTAAQDPNYCSGSANGVFTSPGNLGTTVTKAFNSGRWPARTPASCHTNPGFGRLGQETAMVPAGSTSLTICSAQKHLTSGYQSLVTALNSLPTRTSTSTLRCSDAPGPSGPFYRLLFSYRQGPPVQVMVNSRCDPAIGNFSLQAVSASSVVPIVRHLLGNR